jgi:hypothetical protein
VVRTAHLQDDRSVQAAQDRLIDLINDDPRYGQEAYNVPDSNDLSSAFTANGSSGDWKQARRVRPRRTALRLAITKCWI